MGRVLCHCALTHSRVTARTSRPKTYNARARARKRGHCDEVAGIIRERERERVVCLAYSGKGVARSRVITRRRVSARALVGDDDDARSPKVRGPGVEKWKCGERAGDSAER